MIVITKLAWLGIIILFAGALWCQLELRKLEK